MQQPKKTPLYKRSFRPQWIFFDQHLQQCIVINWKNLILLHCCSALRFCSDLQLVWTRLKGAFRLASIHCSNATGHWAFSHREGYFLSLQMPHCDSAADWGEPLRPYFNEKMWAIKSSPNYSKRCSKNFKIAQKWSYILATFERKFVTQNFKKSPNLIWHWLTSRLTNNNFEILPSLTRLHFLKFGHIIRW